MSFIKRHILEEAKLLATQFRAVSIVGPRQSGKTTLSKWVFGDKPYVNLENPAVQAEAESDVDAFLKQYPQGAILDEVQRVPDIFRQLQGILDSNKKRGRFVLTGSNNFLLQEKISQSLAGRIGYLQLLPLSFAELSDVGLASDNILKHIITGGYPEIWDMELRPDKWLSGYIQTYVQRDVRLLRNITNLGDFNRFVLLCAGYAGQIINRDEMARNIGVDTKTIQAWLGVLESSYILFRLQPWYNNLNKRIIKSPKLYFYDTGLLCHMLNIHSQSALLRHTHYGAIFENWVISEIIKNRFNQGNNNQLYYFRDSAGNEVDLIIEKNNTVFGIEVKSGKSWESRMLDGLKFWIKNNPSGRGILIFGGEREESITNEINLLPWSKVGSL